MIRRLSSCLAEMAPRYDVIVVGSGYGGAIAACRLAEEGRRVCVLERGREIRPGEYPDTLMKVLGDVQIDLPARHLFSPTALFDFRLNTEINVLVGSGLGGTSLINANVALKPAEWVFKDKRWPIEFRRDLTPLEDGFTKAGATLKPTEYPTDRCPPLLKREALQKAAAALPGRFAPAPITVSFSAGKHRSNVPQSACQFCGDCVTGCNYGAKNTLLMNYLPEAHRAGAKIFTEVCVQSVEQTAGEWTVYFDLAGADRKTFGDVPLSIRAGIVILAAGTLGSTEILLRSRDRHRLSLSGQLGRRFTGNGDVLALAYNCTTPIDSVGAGAHRPDPHEPVGPCITGIIDLRGNGNLEEEMVIQDGSIPGALSRMIPALLGGAAVCWGRSTATPSAASIPEQVSRWSRYLAGAYHGAMRRTQIFLVMTHDDAHGRMTLLDDRLRIDWPRADEQPIFNVVQERLLRASAALGGTFIPNPFRPITVHPLGGCCMADDPSTGVVDHQGRVFREDGTPYTNLYVCDGSVIPRSLGVNPLLTIAALAERTCELLMRSSPR